MSDHGLDNNILEYLNKYINHNSLVLELGAGLVSTPYLAERCRVISVEHDRDYIGLYDKVEYWDIPLHYYRIPHFPKQTLWYHYTPLKEKLAELDQSPDIILIDGPPGHIGRGGFLKFLDLFIDIETNVWSQNPMLVFDDVNRQEELRLIQKVSNRLQLPFKYYPNHGRSFGVINEKEHIVYSC